MVEHALLVSIADQDPLSWINQRMALPQCLQSPLRGVGWPPDGIWKVMELGFQNQYYPERDQLSENRKTYSIRGRK